MGNASERRIERVKSLLQSTLADVIRDELADPRLGIFSMTELRLSKDLSHCDVLVAAVGGREPSEQTVLVLNRASKLLWNRIREETDLRTVPKLHFTADHRGEYSDHIFQLIEELPPPAPDADAVADDTDPVADGVGDTDTDAVAENTELTPTGQTAGTEDDH